jgi:heme-degrading monooxygenase HmoA
VQITKGEKMIASLTLYPNSIEPGKLEALVSKQIESMKKAKGLQGIKASKDHLMSPGGPPAYAKVLETTWESLEDFMAWAQSQTPEAHAEKDFLIENGAVLIFYEVEVLGNFSSTG